MQTAEAQYAVIQVSATASNTAAPAAAEAAAMNAVCSCLWRQTTPLAEAAVAVQVTVLKNYIWHQQQQHSSSSMSINSSSTSQRN
jgi:hypothetical protein